MRYRPLIGLCLLATLAGCTGTKISNARLEQLQSNAAGRADSPDKDQVNAQLWYVGSRLVYDYFDYEYDTPAGEHVTKIFHVKKSADGGDLSFVPESRFYYTTDRSKWVKYNAALPTSRPANTTKPAAKPATKRTGITLDDLHT